MTVTDHTHDESTDTTDAHDTVNRESHPNADSADGLAGDMGVSSERRGPFEGIEVTGSLSSAQDTTDGETAMPSVPAGTHGTAPAGEQDPEQRPPEEGEAGPDKPDDTARVSNVDRTVGEVQPDPVTDKHQFDPAKNPRH